MTRTPMKIVRKKVNMKMTTMMKKRVKSKALILRKLRTARFYL